MNFEMLRAYECHLDQIEAALAIAEDAADRAYASSKDVADKLDRDMYEAALDSVEELRYLLKEIEDEAAAVEEAVA